MSSKPLRKLAIVVTLAGMSASPGIYANGTTFTDDTFNLADYTATASFTQNGSLASSQCSSCGNPGFALRFDATFGDTTQVQGFLDLGFVNNAFLFDPSSQGHIVSITASVSKDLSTTLNASPSNPFGNTFRPLIEQGGTFYLAAIPGPGWLGGDTGFLTLSASGLQASDFLQFDFGTGQFLSGHPDFSGGLMHFGLGQIFSAGGLPPGEFAAIYDNLAITVSVPEPHGLWLMAAALALLFAMRVRPAGAR